MNRYSGQFMSPDEESMVEASMTLWWLTSPLSALLTGSSSAQCAYVAKKILDARDAQLAFGPLPKEALDDIQRRYELAAAEAVARRMEN